MTETAIPGAEELRGLAQELTELLRLRTLPIGVRLFEDPAALDAIPGLRRPKKGAEFSTCQLVTQARIAGLTLGSSLITLLTVCSDTPASAATCLIVTVCRRRRRFLDPLSAGVSGRSNAGPLFPSKPRWRLCRCNSVQHKHGVGEARRRSESRCRGCASATAPVPHH